MIKGIKAACEVGLGFVQTYGPSLLRMVGLTAVLFIGVAMMGKWQDGGGWMEFAIATYFLGTFVHSIDRTTERAESGSSLDERV